MAILRADDTVNTLFPPSISQSASQSSTHCPSKYLYKPPKMLPLLLVPLLFALLPSLITAQNTTTPNPTSALNITAITASNNASTLECWTLSPFTVSNTLGTVGSLSAFFGEASNVSYTVIPPRTNAGLHRAPAAQYVFVLSTCLSICGTLGRGC